jgi:hypothetical protein
MGQNFFDTWMNERFATRELNVVEPQRDGLSYDGSKQVEIQIWN